MSMCLGHDTEYLVKHQSGRYCEGIFVHDNKIYKSDFEESRSLSIIGCLLKAVKGLRRTKLRSPEEEGILPPNCL